MKKFLITFLLLISFLQSQTFIAKAESEKNFYAKVQSTNVMFYDDATTSNPTFEIPYSYFVKVNGVSNEFYISEYKNKIGYIKKSEVKLMQCTPTNPYAVATFQFFTPSKIYAKPQTSSETLETVDDLTTKLTYYGKSTGEYVSSSNNIWYYCSFSKNGTTQFGYAFSGVTDYLSTISVNSENYNVVSEDNLTQSNVSFTELSTNTKILLIVSISIPSALILYFLIKPSKLGNITNTKKKIKKEKQHAGHKDYYEFDQNEL